MAKHSQTLDFGKFMSSLAQAACPASTDMVKNLQEKLQKEKQDRMESALRGIFSSIQVKVAELRRIRRMEKAVQNDIAELETRANKIVAGDDSDES